MTAKKSKTRLDKRRKYDDAFRAEALYLATESRSTQAAALKASSYLRRLSSDIPLVLVTITEEIYVLLLSVMPKPPHYKIGLFQAS